MRRFPRFIAEIDTAPEDGSELSFDDTQDLRGGDTLVFADASMATVNGARRNADGSMTVVLGADPTCAPRPNSGRPKGRNPMNLFTVEIDQPNSRYVVTFNDSAETTPEYRQTIVNGLATTLRPGTGTVEQVDDLTYQITV